MQHKVVSLKTILKHNSYDFLKVAQFVLHKTYASLSNTRQNISIVYHN